MSCSVPFFLACLGVVCCLSVIFKGFLKACRQRTFFLGCLGVVCCFGVLFKSCLRACRQRTFFLGLFRSGVGQRFIASLAGGFVHAKH